MVNRNETNTARRSETLHDKNAPAFHTYTSRQPKLTIASISDDVIVSLASAYENERARQVTEWERMRHQNMQVEL